MHASMHVAAPLTSGDAMTVGAPRSGNYASIPGVVWPPGCPFRYVEGSPPSSHHPWEALCATYSPLTIPRRALFASLSPFLIPRRALFASLSVFNTPREAITRVNTPLYTQGGYNPGIHRCIYTPREAIPGHIPPVIHTQGGYTRAYTTCYTPQGGYTQGYTPVIHLRGAIPGINFSYTPQGDYTRD